MEHLLNKARCEASNYETSELIQCWQLNLPFTFSVTDCSATHITQMLNESVKLLQHASVTSFATISVYTESHVIYSTYFAQTFSGLISVLNEHITNNHTYIYIKITRSPTTLLRRQTKFEPAHVLTPLSATPHTMRMHGVSAAANKLLCYFGNKNHACSSQERVLHNHAYIQDHIIRSWNN